MLFITGFSSFVLFPIEVLIQLICFDSFISILVDLYYCFNEVVIDLKYLTLHYILIKHSLSYILLLINSKELLTIYIMY